MSSRTFEYRDYISRATASAVWPGAPIATKPIRKIITVSSVDYEVDLPGSTDFDIEELEMHAIFTAETVTAPTIDVDWEVSMDPLASHTRVNLTAGYSASATSIVVDDGAGAGIGTSTVAVPLLFATFEDTGSYRRMTGYEWAMCTSVSTDTLTVTRGIYGTSGIALSDDTFVFYSQAWVPFVDSAGNVIKLNDLAIAGATAVAPVVGRLSLATEGLTSVPFPAFRVKVEAPSGGTTDHAIHLSGKRRSA